MNQFGNQNPFETPNTPQPSPAQGHGQRKAASGLDAIVPTNPLAAFSCYSGIFGMLLCPLGVVLGPLALLLGILSIKLWKVQESSLGGVMSNIRLVIGFVTGAIGTIIGAIFWISFFSNGFK